MLIQALSNYAGSDGQTWFSGDKVNVPDAQARELIAEGYAVDPAAPATAPKNVKAAAKKVKAAAEAATERTQ